jgi:hypothetical protein
VNNGPVLSIVIPTRNRAEYALCAIRQVLSIDQTDMQLVVQDNSDDDSLRHMCAEYAEDRRLIYNYSPGTLSFVDNFNEAVSLAKGEYVAVIGDDDGVNPEILDVARWARARGVQAIKPGLQAVFFWPNVGLSFTVTTGDTGVFVIEPIAGDVTVRPTGPQLKRLLNDGCQEYLGRDLVKLYHGMVRRDGLERVRETTGSYLGGLSPDIYGAVALSAVIDEVVCIDYPLTIPGVCRTSGSADSGTGRHIGELRDAPHFAGHSEYEWAAEVPEFYSVETIWADSALAAVRDMRRTDLLASFKPQYLAGFCMLRHAEYGSLVREHYVARQKSRGLSVMRARAALSVAIGTIRIHEWVAARWPKKAKSRSEGVRLDGIGDISLASHELKRHLETAGLSVQSCLEEADARFSAKGAAR